MSKFYDAINGVGKYILCIEVMLVLVAALGFFTVDKIKNGDFETTEIAGLLHFEGCEQPQDECPNCKAPIYVRQVEVSVKHTTSA